MPKKLGVAFVFMGAVLIISALLLFLYNEFEDRSAGASAEVVLDNMQAVIVEETSEVQITPDLSTLPVEMPVSLIDGYGYIGYLSIPDLQLELPVMDKWDYPRLRVAPCRHLGSARSDDLVIAAHNYDAHFGRLHSLAVGAEIYLTDMDGIVYQYALVKLDTAPPDAVEMVLDSDYDLVLYTCTPGGATRVVAFCERLQ